MTIYYLFKDDQREYTCTASGGGIIDAFSQNGCINVSETEFLSSDIVLKSSDTVIVYISLKNDECIKKLLSSSCVKVLHSLDERKSDGVLFRTQLEFCERFGVSTMINTYPSQTNINFLKTKGIKTLTLPLCGKNRNIDFNKKDIDVLISGQLDSTYYPTRVNIVEALQTSDVNVVYLPHSGMSTSNSIHGIHGNNFQSLLDRCWLGVTCKAGYRDRMVAKYIEFGFSGVLPIGDVPTYMHPDMSDNMIVVDEHTEHDKIIKLVKTTLSDKSLLKKKIMTYSKYVNDHHDIDINVKRVISMLKNGEHDTL
jgi:hypothetical protein